MGQSPSSDSYNAFSNGLPFYQGNADFGEDNPTPRIWCTDPKKIAEKGDILISVRAPIGAINIASEQCCIGRGIAAIRPNTELASRDYLRHQLRASRDKLEAMGTGSTFKAIGKKALGDFAITIYPKKGQEAIACQFNWVADHIKLANSQLAQLDNLVKSRFVEMFGGLGSDGLRSLKDVCSIITDGTHQPPKFVDEGIPFLFVSNIASDAVDYETNKFISVEDYEQLIRRTPIEIGDVLVSAVGSFGHPAVVRNGRPFCFQRHIAYLKPRHDLVDSNYLHAVLLSDEAQRYMERCAKGVAQRTVTLKSFREMKIPVPPMSLQEEFAAFVQHVDKLRFDVQQQIDKLELLKSSLMQEYFG